MRYIRSGLALALVPAVLASCTAPPAHQHADQALPARYAPYLGPPIGQFTWLGHFWNWEALGKDELLVFTTPNDAYFLKVWPTCDLRFDLNRRGDEVIGVTSTSGVVSSGLDSVIEDSTVVGHMRCPISEIRKLDYRRMVADQRAQAQQKGKAAPAGGSAPH
ncbi:MAG TPA: DUF6491 family protein [Steroidobacteraceae bacterium]|nr:DUF6491 family protein [Steroidobacteraceae bacterium]